MTRADHALIHPSAVVDERAVIGEGVRIGPFSVVGPDVVLEPGRYFTITFKAETGGFHYR